MAGQRTDEVSSLFNSFPPFGRPQTAEEIDEDDASYSIGSDHEIVTVYHPPITDSSSWNFAPEEHSEEMRRLRSESAAQKQKAVAAEKQARGIKAISSVRGKGKAKAIVESEEEEEMSVSEEADAGGDGDGDEEGDIDVEGELSEVQRVDSEDDDVLQSPLKPRLKIKLKLPIVPASSTSNTATPVPEEQKMTPGRRAVAKRSAAVRGRRRIQDIESSSEIESEDGESELVEEEEDDDDEDVSVGVDNTSTTTRTAQPGSKSRSMTTRQAVLASVVDSSHIALDSDLAAQSVQGNSSKKKKVLNETELALRREENARKRKNLSEKRLEDEKLETINRLLKKQTRPRTKRTGGPSQAHSAGSSVPPAPTSASTTTRGGKRGGAGRGRGGRRGRPRAADEEDGDVEGDAIELDGQEGENEEGIDDENREEGEEGDVPDGSSGGSDRPKPAQGPVVPMFKWVSTSIFEPATGSSATPQPAVRSTSQDQNAAKIRNDCTGDVDMADASNESNVAPPPSAESDENRAPEVPLATKPSTVSASSNGGIADNSPLERRMQFYLAIPVAFLPLEDQTIPTPVPLPETRPPATCAVSGCVNPRKYRLVRDWKIGACGMAHLKVLEGMI
ncbi:hypothetical protein F5890DRAFT_1589536 [Lentinula detonsa]|uniref:INO80 complex subunit B-like conserved region domain-containing protein n=1 Tax=Lentinula detonsa TaxID=2804962 RepID=A0AA38ULY8_9AGAR|nr:hypothetical protein F5890DRAFT_1589536 [Lentinula detonsa]